MLYDLIRVWRGKESVMMTDSLPKVRAYMKQLKRSQRRGINNNPVSYFYLPSDETKKYKKPLNKMDLSGDSQIPCVQRK